MLTKLKQSLSDNKVMLIFVPLIISWCIWATTSVFSLEKKQAVSDQCVSDMCQNISEIKYKLDKNHYEIVETKEEILRLLLSINREVKAKLSP